MKQLLKTNKVFGKVPLLILVAAMSLNVACNRGTKAKKKPAAPATQGATEANNTADSIEKELSALEQALKNYTDNFKFTDKQFSDWTEADHKQAREELMSTGSELYQQADLFYAGKGTANAVALEILAGDTDVPKARIAELQIFMLNKQSLAKFKGEEAHKKTVQISQALHKGLQEEFSSPQLSSYYIPSALLVGSLIVAKVGLPRVPGAAKALAAYAERPLSAIKAGLSKLYPKEKVAKMIQAIKDRRNPDLRNIADLKAARDTARTDLNVVSVKTVKLDNPEVFTAESIVADLDAIFGLNAGVGKIGRLNINYSAKSINEVQLLDTAHTNLTQIVLQDKFKLKVFVDTKTKQVLVQRTVSKDGLPEGAESGIYELTFKGNKLTQGRVAARMLKVGKKNADLSQLVAHVIGGKSGEILNVSPKTMEMYSSLTGGIQIYKKGGDKALKTISKKLTVIKKRFDAADKKIAKNILAEEKAIVKADKAAVKAAKAPSQSPAARAARATSEKAAKAAKATATVSLKAWQKAAEKLASAKRRFNGLKASQGSLVLGSLGYGAYDVKNAFDATDELSAEEISQIEAILSAQ